MNKMLKRSLSFVLIGAMIFSATACGNKIDQNKQSEAKSGTQINNIQSKNSSSQSKIKKETNKTSLSSSNELKKDSKDKQDEESSNAVRMRQYGG